MIGYTIVGGFLGAGKTSLIIDMLSRATERIAVVVNDLGDLGFDAELIARASGDEGVIELKNGCVCCSIGDSLAITLRSLTERDPRPERIVIECSGAAQPGRVAAYGSRRVLEEPSVLTVVDATDVRRRAIDQRFARLVEAQLEAADVLVVSKTDLVDVTATAAVTDWLSTQVPDTPIVVGRPVDLGAALVGHRPSDGPLPLTLSTTEWTLDQPVELSALEARLRSAGAVRAKGIVETVAGTEVVQWAADRLTHAPWPHGQAGGRITVIS